MNDLLSIFITVIGVLIFIAILPTLLWLILIIGVVVIAYVQYHKYKYKKMMDAVEKETQQAEEYYQNDYETRNDYETKEIIDVEYTEREDVE